MALLKLKLGACISDELWSVGHKQKSKLQHVYLLTLTYFITLKIYYLDT